MERTGRLFIGLMILAVSVSVGAQRGGGRGADRPLNRTSYDSPDYGFKLAVPANMDLYTSQEPGGFRRVFTPGRIVFIVNPQHPEESISIKVADKVTEADLASYKTMLESNPPQAKLPGFLKVGLADIMIGKDGTKAASSFVYSVEQAQDATQPTQQMTFRQLNFLHNGRGFTLICEAQAKRFEKVNKDTFDKFLAKLEFR